MNFQFYIFFLLIGSFCCSFGQLDLEKQSNYKILDNGEELLMAWSGGMNAPQFSNIDLNLDGTLDLIVFEKNFFGKFKPFLLVDGEYQFAPEYLKSFPEINNWALFVDFNCDGKKDIFCSTTNGVAVYKNISNEVDGLEFVLEKDLLYTQGNNFVNLYVSAADVPAILDVDNDGDVDVLSFGVSGNYIEFHENQSMDLYGHCDSLEFIKVSECWGEFEEAGGSNDLTLNVTCGKSHEDNLGERHAGSSLLAFDNDGDGDKEILLGDVSYPNMVFARNGGNDSYAVMDTVINNFPNNTTPVNISLFPAGFYVELYGESQKSLIAASNLPNLSRDVNNVMRYSNNGTTDQPVFNFEENDFLQGQMLDIGTGARPVLLDFNNDGLMDVVLANTYLYDEQNGSYASLTLLLNEGTGDAPLFNLVEDDLFGLHALELINIHPAFFDLDADGDLDMLIGDANGELSYFVNHSQSLGAYDFVLTQSEVGGIDVGSYAIPFLFDMDEDGDADLIIGMKNGELSYVPNTGSVNSFSFSSANLVADFGGIDVMPLCCTGYSVPFVYQEGEDNYMVVSSESGIVYRYKNVDVESTVPFELMDSVVTYTYRTASIAYDFDGDLKTDWIIGEHFGGLQYYQEADTVDNVMEHEVKALYFYPNPASNAFYVEDKFNGKMVTITNALGQIVLQEDIENGRVDLKDLLPGVFLVIIEEEAFRYQGKLMVH